MDLGLENRVVLITGAGGGAGPAIARAFASEGAVVALHQRRPGAGHSRAERTAEEIRSAGGRASPVAADLRSATEVEAMVDRLAGELGSVSVLVTATSAYRNDRFIELDDDAWMSVVEDMLGATYRACRAVVPGMQAQRWGRIVNIASRSGLVGVGRAAHYAAAKAGILGLTRALAKELGPDGVLANAVAPTQIRTVKDGQPSIPDDRAAELAKQIPARRVATPEDLAALVLWLGSAANTYVSGETISLTGGAQS